MQSQAWHGAAGPVVPAVQVNLDVTCLACECGSEWVLSGFGSFISRIAGHHRHLAHVVLV